MKTYHITTSKIAMTIANKPHPMLPPRASLLSLSNKSLVQCHKIYTSKLYFRLGVAVHIPFGSSFLLLLVI